MHIHYHEEKCYEDEIFFYHLGCHQWVPSAELAHGLPHGEGVGAASRVGGTRVGLPHGGGTHKDRSDMGHGTLGCWGSGGPVMLMCPLTGGVFGSLRDLGIL